MPRESFTPLTGVQEIAERMGVHRSTARRWLKQLAKTEGPSSSDWLFRMGVRAYSVNESILKHRHPSVFEHRFATRDRMERAEELLAAHTKRINALGARVRKCESALFSDASSGAIGSATARVLAQ